MFKMYEVLMIVDDYRRLLEGKSFSSFRV